MTWQTNKLGQIAIGSFDRTATFIYSLSTLFHGKTYIARETTLAKFCKGILEIPKPCARYSIYIYINILALNHLFRCVDLLLASVICNLYIVMLNQNICQKLFRIFMKKNKKWYRYKTTIISRLKLMYRFYNCNIEK